MVRCGDVMSLLLPNLFMIKSLEMSVFVSFVSAVRVIGNSALCEMFMFGFGLLGPVGDHCLL